MPRVAYSITSSVDHAIHSAVPVSHATAASLAFSIQVRVPVLPIVSVDDVSVPIALTDV